MAHHRSPTASIISTLRMTSNSPVTSRVLHPDVDRRPETGSGGPLPGDGGLFLRQVGDAGHPGAAPAGPKRQLS